MGRIVGATNRSNEEAVAQSTRKFLRYSRRNGNNSFHCEAVMNIRPLTYSSENPTDLTPLTPSLFLQDVEEVGVPDLDLVEATDLNQRLMYRQQLKQILTK